MDERLQRADDALRRLILARRQLRAAKNLYEAANTSRNVASREWEEAKETVAAATVELNEAIEALPDEIELPPAALIAEHRGDSTLAEEATYFAALGKP